MLGPRLDSLIEGQRPHLPLWYPVAFGAGIGAYFLIPAEPEPWMLAALGATLLLLAATAWRVGPAPRFLLVLVIMTGLGFAAVTWRSWSVAAPVLPWEMTVTVEGRIIGLDRSASNRARILLDRVVIHGLEPDRTPAQVRISVDEATPQDALQPGQRVIGQARLSPPSAPSEPGGFDFRQMAWFARLGAVGYTGSPMIEAEADGAGGWRQLVYSFRLRMSRTIQAAIPGKNGGFASAILTGDRSGIDPGSLVDLRASNLAHLLAISGLHMGLLTGFVFGLIRYGLALVPVLALRLPLKKIAAATALAAGLAYLLLSGASVATQRAFIMTSVILVAVLIDRPAFSLRSVALAAMIILVIRPESLTEAGFQMSFAATAALIATFEWLRHRDWWRRTQGRSWRFAKPVIGVAVTSFVAGLATAPISAFHFNQMSQYGLLANILGVPAMGLVVMPAAVIAGILGLVGLAGLPLMVMDLGIGYILKVAAFVAGLDGALRAIPAGPTASLPLIVLGGIVLILWIGRGRAAGLVLIAAGIGLWTQVDRPEILISDDGRLIGVMTDQGRALNTPRGNGFAAENWLRNDGDLADQASAHARGAMQHSRGRMEMAVPGLGTLVYRGSREPDAQDLAECRSAAILVAPNWRDPPEGDCLFFGRQFLRREGALAIRLGEEGPVIVGAKTLNATRPWTLDPRGARTPSAPPPRTAGQAIASERPPADVSANTEVSGQ